MTFNSKKSSDYWIFADFGYVILTILSAEMNGVGVACIIFFPPQKRILPVYDLLCQFMQFVSRQELINVHQT